MEAFQSIGDRFGTNRGSAHRYLIKVLSYSKEICVSGADQLASDTWWVEVECREVRESVQVYRFWRQWRLPCANQTTSSTNRLFSEPPADYRKIKARNAEKGTDWLKLHNTVNFRHISRKRDNEVHIFLLNSCVKFYPKICMHAWNIK